jgi:hypothetical protein
MAVPLESFKLKMVAESSTRGQFAILSMMHASGELKSQLRK